ncbi:MAG: hypothetical protein J6T27_01465 [Alphaproteobacteria bacterium]|nr:hypothetical protein [Alphaproteobacteria bacterium]
MKKNKMKKLCGALFVANGVATLIWAGAKIGADNLADTGTKAPVTEKQSIIKEFCSSDPKYVALGFFGAMTLIGGVSIINKSKEK